MRAPRLTLTSRLLVAGFVFTVAVVGSISSYLLLSRSHDGENAALANATNRAVISRQLLGAVVATPAEAAARSLAAHSDLKAALASSDPNAVAALLGKSQLALFSDTNLVVLRYSRTSGMSVVFTTECGGGTHDLAAPSTLADVSSCEASTITPHVSGLQSSVVAFERAAKLDGQLVEGTEFLGFGQSFPAYDVAGAVQAKDGSLVGVVVYSTPLVDALTRYRGVIGYNPVIVTMGANQPTLRIKQQATSVTPTVATVRRDIANGNARFNGANNVQLIYNLAGVPVAGSFVELSSPGNNGIAGYLGVEIPVSVYEGNTKGLLSNVIGLGITAVLLVFFLILLFVHRFVRRPLRLVEKGVSRIAGGDYSTAISVTSDDELGRLARGVNRMREQIAGYVDHLAGSVGQLKAVSRALTTTTAGVVELREAVVQAAHAIAGGGSAAIVVTRDNAGFEHLEARIAALPDGEAHLLIDHGELAGRGRTAFPMEYKENLVGIVVIDTDAPIADADVEALSALASNAAVALENARLFEQEKDTVIRLREIDKIKSDFLTTAQHELRTPILAIMGQLDLISVGWEAWDDLMKLDMIRDIDASTRQMDGLVATMVDYTLLTSDSARLKRTNVPVEPVIDSVLRDLAAERKDGIQVGVKIDVEPGVAVDADRQRFSQALKAILDNAIKFTGNDGRVEVSVRADGDTCHIHVSDTGVGIGEAAMPKLFERFFQEDNSKTRKFGGMGMGLALTKKICELHEADIVVKSAPGEGTTVSLAWAVPTGSTARLTETAGFHIIHA